MPIRARAADGSIHEFPDGTRPEVVDRAMKGYAQSKGGGKAPAKGESLLDKANAFADRNITPALMTFNRNALPFMDEAADGLTAVANYAQGRARSLPDAYTQARGASGKAVADLEATRPNTAALTRGVGLASQALIPAGVGARAVAAAPNLGQAVIRSGVLGATSGGVGGYAAAEGSNRGRSAVQGAIGGAALGAAVPVAVPVVGAIADRVSPYIRQGLSAAAPMVEGVGRAVPAVNDLAGNLAAGMRRMDPSSLSTPERFALQNVARVGRSSGVGMDKLQNAAPDLMAAEVFGPTGARQLGALARREGLTGQNLVTTIGDRRQARPGILTEAFEQATGVRPGDASEIIADVVDTGQKNARPIYELAFNDPIEMTDNLQELLNLPALQGARRRAYRLMQNDRIDPETLGFTVSPESGDLPILVPNGTPNLRVLDYIKRGLDGELRPFRNQVTGRIDTSDPEARQLVGLIGEFRDELTSQSPNYRQALAVSGDYLSAQSAFEQSQRMLGNGMDEFAFTQTLQRMSEGQRQAFRVGAAKWAYDRAQTGKLTPQSLVGQAGARLRAKLTAALGEDSV
jgi:hypothetical protein